MLMESSMVVATSVGRRLSGEALSAIWVKRIAIMTATGISGRTMAKGKEPKHTVKKWIIRKESRVDPMPIDKKSTSGPLKIKLLNAMMIVVITKPDKTPAISALDTMKIFFKIHSVEGFGIKREYLVYHPLLIIAL